MDDHDLVLFAVLFKPMVTWGTPHFGKLPYLCSIEPTQIPVSIPFPESPDQRKEKTPDPTESNAHE